MKLADAVKELHRPRGGRPPIDLLGQQFGHWFVLDLHPQPYVGRNGRNQQARWLCRCNKCGRERVVLSASLRRGLSKSCGCVPNRLKHGHRRNGRATRIYAIWCAMMARCYTPNNQAYARYGGRGIGVCERWHTFTNFLADMGEPAPGKSINRINNDGDYEPDNCEWATPLEQAQNRRPRKKSKLRIELGDPKILAGLKQLNEHFTRTSSPPLEDPPF